MSIRKLIVACMAPTLGICVLTWPKQPMDHTLQKGMDGTARLVGRTGQR
jgi:hypothetical protein